MIRHCQHTCLKQQQAKGPTKRIPLGPRAVCAISGTCKHMSRIDRPPPPAGCLPNPGPPHTPGRDNLPLRLSPPSQNPWCGRLSTGTSASILSPLRHAKTHRSYPSIVGAKFCRIKTSEDMSRQPFSNKPRGRTTRIRSISTPAHYFVVKMHF